jgi:oligopeptide transport system permease protein
MVDKKQQENSSGNPAAEKQLIKGTSLWKDAWRRLLKNKMAVIGASIVCVISIVALLTPIIAPFKFEETHLRDGNRPPYLWEMMNCKQENAGLAMYCSRYIECTSAKSHDKCNKYYLGADQLGRDLMTRIMYGSRVSLMVGLIATLVSIIIGISYGAVSGFVGGRTDNIMMRIVDILYGLPFMFLVILLLVIFHNVPADKKLYLLFIGLGAVQWLTMSRITRGQTLSIKAKEYIMAARTSGASSFRIISKHVIPNLLGPVIVYATLTVPAVMLEEAFLSFLGLGVQAPMASWGSLASEGRQSLDIYPWQIVFPGLSLAITLFCLNFIGDGLRDALDPQMKDQK